MSTAGEKVLPTADEVRGCKTTEQLIEFLGKQKQNLGLEDKHLDFLREQEFKGETFLDLSIKELIDIGLKGGPAKTIIKSINKIKNEDQGKCHDCIRIFQTYTAFSAIISFINLGLIRLFLLYRAKVPRFVNLCSHTH